jgi:hypothetical protein
VKRYKKKYGGKGKLNSEKILKIRKESRFICKKIWKIWKKSKLKSELIGKCGRKVC